MEVAQTTDNVKQWAVVGGNGASLHVVVYTTILNSIHRPQRAAAAGPRHPIERCDTREPYHTGEPNFENAAAENSLSGALRHCPSHGAVLPNSC